MSEQTPRRKPRLRDERITLVHGAGGKATRTLVEAWMPSVGRAEKAHWLCGERFGRRLAPRIGRIGRVGLAG